MQRIRGVSVKKSNILYSGIRNVTESSRVHWTGVGEETREDRSGKGRERFKVGVSGGKVWNKKGTKKVGILWCVRQERKT